MKVDDIYIAGIGTSKHEVIDTAEAVRKGWYGPDDRELGGLLSITVAGKTPAPDLAVEAATYALEQAGHAPAEIGVVFHTNVHFQGPDGWSPRHYINRKTINQSVTSVEIHNGCVGLFSTLHIASIFLNAIPDREAALVTAADNFGTPAADRWHAAPQLFVLADGGGALVLSRRGGFARLLAVDAVTNPELEPHHRGPDALFPPAPTVGGTLNLGERMTYARQQSDAGILPPIEDFGPLLVDTAKRTLADADTSMDEIVKVVHDGFRKEALFGIFLDPLGVEEDRSVWEFTRTVGHAGPVDHIRGLEYAWKNGKVGVGDRVLLVGGSPGMEAACAVVEIIEAP
jgi:3-oxoacyl-[acyl-carrier-protein] synthase III